MFSIVAVTAVKMLLSAQPAIAAARICRLAVQFIGFRVEFRRKLAKFFLGKQLEAVVARRPAPGSKGTEVASGHKLPSNQEHDTRSFSLS